MFFWVSRDKSMSDEIKDSQLWGVQACWDHNHHTNADRRLLCLRCNTALGMLGDNHVLCSRAALYLSTESTYGNMTEEFLEEFRL